ncbi:MAG: outer membrane beta-barrel protein [Alistipes shahii]
MPQPPADADFGLHLPDGNPSLDPAFKQDVNLTLVAAHKYTLTAGVQLVSGEIQQTIQADPENPDLLQLAWVNYDRTKTITSRSICLSSPRNGGN